MLGVAVPPPFIVVAVEGCSFTSSVCRTWNVFLRSTSPWWTCFFCLFGLNDLVIGVIHPAVLPPCTVVSVPVFSAPSMTLWFIISVCLPLYWLYVPLYFCFPLSFTMFGCYSSPFLWSGGGFFFVQIPSSCPYFFQKLHSMGFQSYCTFCSISSPLLFLKKTLSGSSAFIPLLSVAWQNCVLISFLCFGPPLVDSLLNFQFYSILWRSTIWNLILVISPI